MVEVFLVGMVGLCEEPIGIFPDKLDVLTRRERLPILVGELPCVLRVVIGDAERDKGMRILFLLEFVEVCAPFLLGLMVEFAEFLVDAAHLLAGCGEGREQEAWVFPKMLDIFFRVDVVMQVSWTEVDRPGDEVDEVLLHERVVRHGLAGIRERRLIECLAVGWGIFRQDACFLVELLQGLAGWLAERREILWAVGIEDFGWPIKVGDAVERELEAVVFPILVERPVLDDRQFPALLDREAFFPGILFCEEVVPRIAVRRDVGKVAEVIGVAHRDDAAFPAMRADEVASDEVLEGVEVPNGFFCDSLAALAECFPVYEFRCHVYSPLSSGMRMESFLGCSLTASIVLDSIGRKVGGSCQNKKATLPGQCH